MIHRLLLNLTGWYFSKKALPYWGVLILDSLIVLFAYYLGCLLELGGLALATSLPLVTGGALVTVLLFIVPFRMFRTYSGIIRYSSFVDLYHVVLATVVGSLLMMLVSWLLPSSVLFMPDVLGISITFLVTTFLMW